MQGFKILNIDDITYKIQNEETGEIFTHDFSFIDTVVLPQVGDYIAFNPVLLDKNNEGYMKHYFFGELDDVSGRVVLSSKNPDAVVLKTKNKAYAFKRIYG